MGSWDNFSKFRTTDPLCITVQWQWIDTCWLNFWSIHLWLGRWIDGLNILQFLNRNSFFVESSGNLSNMAYEFRTSDPSGSLLMTTCWFGSITCDLEDGLMIDLWTWITFHLNQENAKNCRSWFKVEQLNNSTKNRVDEIEQRTDICERSEPRPRQSSTIIYDGEKLG